MNTRRCWKLARGKGGSQAAFVARRAAFPAHDFPPTMRGAVGPQGQSHRSRRKIEREREGAPKAVPPSSSPEQATPHPQKIQAKKKQPEGCSFILKREEDYCVALLGAFASSDSSAGTGVPSKKATEPVSATEILLRPEFFALYKALSARAMASSS